MTTFLNTYHFLATTYLVLLFLFSLGVVGLLILSYRTVNDEYCGVLSFDYVVSEFLESISEMADNLGGLSMIVVIVFSVIGWIFFLLAFTPRSLLKKLGFT